MYLNFYLLPLVEVSRHLGRVNFLCELVQSRVDETILLKIIFYKTKIVWHLITIKSPQIVLVHLIILIFDKTKNVWHFIKSMSPQIPCPLPSTPVLHWRSSWLFSEWNTSQWAALHWSGSSEGWRNGWIYCHDSWSVQFNILTTQQRVEYGSQTELDW